MIESDNRIVIQTMKSFIIPAFAALASACKYSMPDGVSAFDMDTFSGFWKLNKSTTHREDRVGCAFWQMTKADEDGNVNSSFSKVKMYSYNKYEKGRTWTREDTYTVSDSGVFTKQYFFGLLS